MNINQLKAFLNDKPAHLGAENSAQNQLRDSGLRQSAALQTNQTQVNSDKFSSSSSFGVRILASALNTTIELDGKKSALTEGQKTKSNKSMFDFEEVAKNVLKFVGGAIKNAKNNGADETKLNNLFEQATDGVLKGIKLAEKDLAGFMNEDIRGGIDNAKKLIDEGIANLKKDIFAKADSPETEKGSSVNSSTQVSATDLRTGGLSIQTKDGDEVKLSFSQIRQFSLNQSEQQKAALAESNTTTKKQESPDVKHSTTGNSEEQNEASDLSAADNPKNRTNSVKQQEVLYYENNALQFSVTGELDEEELKAIGQLVSDANSLADDFFKGDIEAAYNQALKLGFDDQELTGFALQLTKVENTQVIKTYETVSHYGGNDSESEPAKAVKPVSQYLDKMLSVVEDSRALLKDGSEYENMINSLINEMGEVHTPDLIQALNRFHSFNQKLLDSLPLTSK